MAYYNPYFQNYNFNPNYNPGYAAQAPPPPVAQGGDFVPIPSEEDARNYPIQRGTSVTFKDENLPYIYIKRLGMGQLDSPTFEVYEIKKRTPQSTQRAESAPLKEETDKLSNYVTKAEYGEICDEIEHIRETVERLRKELGA